MTPNMKSRFKWLQSNFRIPARAWLACGRGSPALSILPGSEWLTTGNWVTRVSGCPRVRDWLRLWRQRWIVGQGNSLTTVDQEDLKTEGEGAQSEHPDDGRKKTGVSCTSVHLTLPTLPRLDSQGLG